MTLRKSGPTTLKHYLTHPVTKVRDDMNKIPEALDARTAALQLLLLRRNGRVVWKSTAGRIYDAYREMTRRVANLEAIERVSAKRIQTLETALFDAGTARDAATAHAERMVTLANEHGESARAATSALDEANAIIQVLRKERDDAVEQYDAIDTAQNDHDFALLERTITRLKKRVDILLSTIAVLGQAD